MASRAPTRRTALATASAVLLVAGAPPLSSPRRIVSLNPCLDAILVEVADRGQIGALSHYARDPQGSTIADIARTWPFTDESAEQVMMLRPDLVLASRHTSPATLAALRRFGVRVALFGVPKSVEESLAQVTQIAEAVARPKRGEALAARIRAALAAAAPAPEGPPISALVFQPQGFAPGDATLMGEMLRRTGFANAASRYGLKTWGNVSLEQLLADPPQVLLAGETRPGAPTWAERVLSHPALYSLRGRTLWTTFPERLLYCGGPALITTAAVLAQAHRRAQALG